MTKYTLDQLKEMTNEQLDEVAALAQGWWLYTNRYLGTHAEGHEVYMDWWASNEITGKFKTNELFMSKDDYHPTTNKAQAWDLLTSIFSGHYKTDSGWRLINHGNNLSNQVVVDGDINLLVAVVIASILHLQESE